MVLLNCQTSGPTWPRDVWGFRFLHGWILQHQLGKKYFCQFQQSVLQRCVFRYKVAMISVCRNKWRMWMSLPCIKDEKQAGDHLSLFPLKWCKLCLCMTAWPNGQGVWLRIRRLRVRVPSWLRGPASFKAIWSKNICNETELNASSIDCDNCETVFEMMETILLCKNKYYWQCGH